LLIVLRWRWIRARDGEGLVSYHLVVELHKIGFIYKLTGQIANCFGRLLILCGDILKEVVYRVYMSFGVELLLLLHCLLIDLLLCYISA